MSVLHPVVAITGPAGAATTSVTRTFQQIFRRENIHSAVVEGDAFRRYDRIDMKQRLAEEAERGNLNFSHFGPDTNLDEKLEALFRDYGARGHGCSRRYLYDAEQAASYGQQPGTFTAWEELAADSDLLFYAGLHGAVKTATVDVARHVDLLIGVVPVINLEWMQKLHRDRAARGYATEAVTHTVLRRMPDYVNYIVPQFSRTHVNFQRVPLVDTSNPFVSRHIPTADESMLVIRFADPGDVDFAYLLSMLDGSVMSRADTIVCPGGKMDLAMQLIFTPMIRRLMAAREKAWRASS